jgi:hypothetical protein
MLKLTQAILSYFKKVKLMPTWEETKRTGQTAFISRENGLEDVHGSIGELYRQLLSTGHIYPSSGAESLTRQIAEDRFPEIEQEPDMQREIGLEPEQDTEPER